MKDVKIVNAMADGSVCEDLNTYVSPEHPLPDLARRLILEFIKEGHRIRQEQAGG